MGKRYKKEKAIMIDLSDRKKIKIIETEKITVSDYDTEILREQVAEKTKAIEDFNDYFIKKEVASKKSISDEEFNNALKKLYKQHKILKYMLEDQK